MNWFFYAFKNKAHTGNNFWGIGNRQKVLERMHWNISCLTFFHSPGVLTHTSLGGMKLDPVY